MKTTKTMQVTLLALALCAFLAIPASAYAFGMPGIDTSGIEAQIQAAAAAAAQLEAAEPVHQHLVPIGKKYVISDLKPAVETTLGEPPAADDKPDPGDLHIEEVDESAEPAKDPTHADQPGITVVTTSSTTPQGDVPDQPIFVREPELPFTGGDALPFLAGGALLMVAGVSFLMAGRSKSTNR
ncbi:MAG: hypothetical protein Q7W30_01250 [Coriobacteriia bacterium]|nr:hypothetical protein [Coriobacteriia bacterium]